MRVSTKRSSGSGADGYRTSVHFESINEDDRDRLVRYTFQRQRELLRNNTDFMTQESDNGEK
jgi:c-di-GMP-binding flagellar brake protein YcgR